MIDIERANEILESIAKWITDNIDLTEFENHREKLFPYKEYCYFRVLILNGIITISDDYTRELIDIRRGKITITDNKYTIESTIMYLIDKWDTIKEWILEEYEEASRLKEQFESFTP